VKDDIDSSTPRQIERAYGVFIAKTCAFGGLARRTYVVDAQESDTKSSISANLAAQYGGSLFSCNMAAGGKTESSQWNKEVNIQTSFNCKGGNTNIWLGYDETTNDSFAQFKQRWAESINPNNFYAMEYALMPLWDVIKVWNPTKSQEFERYLKRKWRDQLDLYEGVQDYVSSRPNIDLRRTNRFSRFFDDRSTGSNKDGSLWKPNENSYWFGMVASGSYNSPGAPGVWCRTFEGDLLAQPQYWEKVWDDRGTGAKGDRSLWRPVPPPGYVALGHVGYGMGRNEKSLSNSSRLSNSNFPNFRCVKRELVEQVANPSLKQIWNDRGSGAKKDGSLWNYVSGNGYCLSYAVNGYGRPSGPIYDFKSSVFATN